MNDLGSFSDPSVLVLLVASIVGVAAVGFWSISRTRTARDYFIAGQGAGLWVVALATMSAAFSGFVFLGGPGLTYRIGIASLFINLPVGFIAGLLCWVLARRLRILSEVREVLTIPDALTCRFGDRWTTGAGCLALLVGTVGYLGAQFLALGVLIQAVLGSRFPAVESLTASVVIGVIIVVAYSAVGGMMAGVYTDVIQGALMLVSAILVFGAAWTVTGGWGKTVSSILGAEAFAGFFNPFGRMSLMSCVGFFFVFGIGVLGQPHMLHKFYMLREPNQLRWLPALLAGSQTVCLLIWIGIGIAVPALVAQGRMSILESPDHAAPRFLLEFTPPLLAGLVVAGVVAAIMSTADSLLNIGAAALIRDLPRLFGRTTGDELLAGRAATLVLAALAAGIGLVFGDLIALLGTFAFGTFAAALAPAMAIGWSWSRVPALAATASICTGLTVNLGLEFWQRSSGLSAYLPGFLADTLPAALALAASIAVLMIGTWLSSPRIDERLPADIRAILEI